MPIQYAIIKNEVTLIPNQFVRQGYIFNGWKTGNNVYYANGVNIGVLNNDLILYAQWKSVTDTMNNSNRSSRGGSSGGGTSQNSTSSNNRIKVLSFDDLLNKINNTTNEKKAQAVPETSLKEVRTFVNSLLDASGLQNKEIVMNNTDVLNKTNEIAKGRDYQKQLEVILTEANNNPQIINQKAAVSTQNINAQNASWTYDNEGNVKLINKFTNEQVTNKWQAVGDDNGNKTWYKFDESGNMQTGLIVDGDHIFYLKDVNDADRGKMAVNETISIGGLSLTFNQDGALTSMNYDEIKAINSLSNAIANAVTFNNTVLN